MTKAALLESYGQPDDKESGISPLVIKAKEGSRGAFNLLIGLFHEDIFRMVYYRIRSRMDSEDLTQDIFIQAFKNIAQLKTIAHFKSWLYRIAINRVRDFYRKKRLRSLIGLFSENEGIDVNDIYDSGKNNPDPLENEIRKDFWHQFEIALECLSRMEKEVFLLRFLDQLGIKEISQALFKSESTVKTHLYRALVKLRKNAALQNFFN